MVRGFPSEPAGPKSSSDVDVAAEATRQVPELAHRVPLVLPLVPKAGALLCGRVLAALSAGQTHVGGVWMASEEVLRRWSGAAILLSPLPKEHQ
jgi:hypothetical protein